MWVSFHFLGLIGVEQKFRTLNPKTMEHGKYWVSFLIEEYVPNNSSITFYSRDIVTFVP